MIEFSLPVKSALGFHARPVTQFAVAVRDWQSAVTLTCEGRTADGRDLMGLMALDACCGQTMDARVEGPDEVEAAGELQALLRELLAS